MRVLLGIAALGFAIGYAGAVRRSLAAGSLGLTIGSAASGVAVALWFVAPGDEGTRWLGLFALWTFSFGLTLVGVLLLAARRTRQALWTVLLACAATWSFFAVLWAPGADLLPLLIFLTFATWAMVEALDGGRHEPRPRAALVGWLTLACFGLVVASFWIRLEILSLLWLVGVLGQHVLAFLVLGVPPPRPRRQEHAVPASGDPSGPAGGSR